MTTEENGRQRVGERHDYYRELFSGELREVHGDGEVLHAVGHAHMQEAAAPESQQESSQTNSDALKLEQGQEMPIGELSALDQIPVGARQTIARYPLLEALLAQKALPLRGVWTLRDVAKIFDVSVRTIQDWIRGGKLVPRDLPGRGKFLSEDLEAFLQNSRRISGRKSEED